MRKKSKPKNGGKSESTGYFRHETLSCWKAATLAALFVKEVHTQFGDMRNQLERSVLSITNNIAEACARHQHGGKNIENLFSHGNGSLGETANMLFFSFRLHAKAAASRDDRVFNDFVREILLKAFHELDCIISNPSLMDSPMSIGIFKADEIVLLDHILREINSGKNVRQVMGDIFVDEKQTKSENNGSAPKDICLECGRKTELQDGNLHNVLMVTELSKSKINCPIFVCIRCSKRKGVPIEMIQGSIVFRPKPDGESQADLQTGGTLIN
ncbi:four helix bundle protein [Candidatus Giovannonibacteria bacterium]|nr:four helix bundle protein [Candidatus Giovannonibacteria bacterium]